MTDGRTSVTHPPVAKPPGDGSRPRTSRRDTQGLVRWTTRVAAVLPGLALVAVIVVLALEAVPVIPVNGLHFFTTNTWNPGNSYSQPVISHGVQMPAGASYGALPLITGTLESSAIAMLIAVPVALGTALVVVDKLPKRLSSAVGMFLEMLAGIPSVVFGLWGALTLGPFLVHHVSPFIASHVPDVPPLRFLKGPVGSGEGLLPSGVVLGIMVLPIVAATTRDLLRQVPRGTREGAMALGMTDAEVIRWVDLRWIRSGFVGACILGLGRALGETMAVAMVSGAVLGANPANLYATMTTIAATIVSQLDYALSDATGFALGTLAEAGLLLMVISLSANVVARFLVRRSSAGVALPVGRGI